jgi:hypothetical protein
MSWLVAAFERRHSVGEGDVETPRRIHRRELQRNSDLDAVLEVISIVAFRHDFLAIGAECE